MSLDRLLQEAMTGRVTYISIDMASGVARVGAWKAPNGPYLTGESADPAEALRTALTPQHDLSDLLV